MSGSSNSLWRDEDPVTFTATILTAAAQMNIQPLAVEKDYWACEALRAIEASAPGSIVFKGGTSLEKLRIIQRFSEDLDLLVIGNFGNLNQTKKAMKAMCEAARAATGGLLIDPKSGGQEGSAHRIVYLTAPTTNLPGPGSALADPSSILLELGQSGGRHPSESRTVTSLLSRALELSRFPIIDFADLRPFDVLILHPGRTFLEKLLRVNNFALMDEARRDRHGWPRIGRQFYDLWQLLDSQEVIDFLKDLEQVREVLDDCYKVSQAFTPDQPPPTGGFAESPIFDVRGELFERISNEHDIAMRDLYYGNDPAPSLTDVIEKVQQNRALLDVG